MNTTTSNGQGRQQAQLNTKRASHFNLATVLWDILPSNFKPMPLTEVETEVKKILPGFDVDDYVPVAQNFEGLMRRMSGFHVYMPAGKPVSMKRGAAPAMRKTARKK